MTTDRERERQEHEDNQEALFKLLKSYDDIAHELRAALLYQLHDQISVDDVLCATPNPKRTPLQHREFPRVGNPVSLKHMIARYLIRWLFETVFEEGGQQAVDFSFVHLWLGIKGRGICTQKLDEDKELNAAMDKYWRGKK